MPVLTLVFHSKSFDDSASFDVDNVGLAAAAFAVVVVVVVVAVAAAVVVVAASVVVEAVVEANVGDVVPVVDALEFFYYIFL